MQKIIAANWKMNKIPKETNLFICELKKSTQNSKCKIITCVPFINLCTAVSAAKNTNIKIGAQNCHWENSGAFTGEISAKMLKDSGVEYIILGHSERRTLFSETDEIINKKVIKALSHGLKVILCVGETLQQRENNTEQQIVANQLKQSLLSVNNIENIVIAYEPVWAIGTGKTITSAQAEYMCRFIRKFISDIYSNKAPNNLNILYGGSINSTNAPELLSQKNVDGGLIGGASLDINEFVKIINAANDFS